MTNFECRARRCYAGPLAILILMLAALPGSSSADPFAKAETAEGVEQVDAYTLRGKKNFLHDFEPVVGRQIQLVVEIPAGNSDKWQVDGADGLMKWDFKDNKPRVVAYLPYPANYGMIPRTKLSKDRGGDGDPLDAIVLAPALRRGEVISARIIGVLKFTDSGERDDKIIAVTASSKLESIVDFAQLEREYPGSLTILETWFTNYKGAGVMTFEGRGTVEDATKILQAAMKDYQEQSAKP